MLAPHPSRHGCEVETDQPSCGRSDGVALALFLLELRADGSTPAALEDMQRALRHATDRLGAAGAPIRWKGGVQVPDAALALCLIEAASQSEVLAARDVAGINSVTVQPVHLRPERQPLRQLEDPTENKEFGHEQHR